jgi:hypothetical protein
MQNKDIAKELFNAGWGQNRIAEALDVSEKTIGDWKKKGNWEQKRTEEALARETSEARLWKLINYQLKALEKKTEEWEHDAEYRLLDKGDIDALSKMYSSVKGKQHTWAQAVELITELTEFIEGKNLDLAKKLLPYTDEFLMNKKGQMV